MKLTILETGRPPEALRAHFEDYPAQFEALLGPADQALTFETVPVIDGAPLPDPAGLDAVLVTGSPAGVYEDLPWMAPLMDFIRWAAAEKTPQVGICFGHQAIAQALGGQVVKSQDGWGIGRHVYEIVTPARWMGDEPPETFALAVSHQDQVVAPPPGAETLASSDFTPHAALSYAQGPAISFQGHPEFTAGYAAALYRLRAGKAYSEADAIAAEASLKTPQDGPLIARWIAKFLKEASET